MNNLYWIYIDYLIRMNTNTNEEQRFDEIPTTTVTAKKGVSIRNNRNPSQDSDSSDDELLTFVTGQRNKTPVMKVDLDEQEELEVDEEASLSSGKTNETALSSGKTNETASGDSFIGINVPESISSEIDDSQQSAIVNQGPSFGRNSSSSDDSSSDIDLAGSDKTEEEQNVAPGEQNVIIAKREVAAAQDGVNAAMRELDDIRRRIEENTYIRTHIN